MFLNYYLIEIKNRVFLLFTVWLTYFFLFFLYKELLLYLCIKPSVTNTHDLNSFYFITTNVAEVLSSYFLIISYICNFLIFLFLIFQIIAFLIPGLYYKERKNLVLIFFSIFLLVLISTFIFYNLILPLSWIFFINYLPKNSHLKLTVFFEPKLIEYLNTFFFIFFLLQIIFQLFLLMFLYITTRKKMLVKLKLLKKKNFIFFLFLSTCLTPPDILSQIILTFLLFSFFEIVSFFFLTRELFLIRQPVKTN